MTKPLQVMSGEELMDMDYKPIKFAVREFLPQGLAILAGAPKTGKSFSLFGFAFALRKGSLSGPAKRQKEPYYISVWRTINPVYKTEPLP
ncbi:uncharacterized protein BN684_00010 [Clostridium sp. CAG:505]|nr:uncharacterized protein BN684_00010 [Clostridium sp. CAG:505]